MAVPVWVGVLGFMAKRRTIFVSVRGWLVRVGMIVLMLCRGRVRGGSLGERVTFEDINFCGGDSAAVYALELKGCVQIEGIGCLLQHFNGDTGVNHGSEEHVAGNPGEAVEVGDSHDSIVSCWAAIAGVGQKRFRQRPEVTCRVEIWSGAGRRLR